MVNDLVSIIVPIYNVEQYLNRCLESIINQTYENIEILLIDDGSTDTSGAICDEYAKKDKRVNVIHKENGGISEARNLGIKIANGKYLTYIDSDDYVANNYVETMYNAIVEDQSDLAIGLHIIKFENGKVKYKYKDQKRQIVDSKKAVEKLLYDDGIDLSVWGKLFKKEIIQKFEFPKGKLFEDAAVTCKIISESEKVSLINEYIYYYCIRDNSISTCTFNEKKIDLIDSTKEMTEYIKLKYPDLNEGCARRLLYAYLSTLTQLAKCSEQKKYIEIRKKLMKYIKNNSNQVLKDKKTPKRDRLAIYACKAGYGFFRIMWKTYEKM